MFLVLISPTLALRVLHPFQGRCLNVADKAFYAAASANGFIVVG
jgi:hypothetical protein